MKSWHGRSALADASCGRCVRTVRDAIRPQGPGQHRQEAMSGAAASREVGGCGAVPAARRARRCPRGAAGAALSPRRGRAGPRGASYKLPAMNGHLHSRRPEPRTVRAWLLPAAAAAVLAAAAWSLPDAMAGRLAPAAATPSAASAAARVPAVALPAPGDLAPGLEQRLAKWKPVAMPWHSAGLGARERQLVEKLVEACRQLESIYWRQSDPQDR